MSSTNLGQLPEEGSFGLGWLDQAQSAASNTANNFANRIDRFFGVPRSDLEAAYSSLRISVEELWFEQFNSDTSLRVRGKIHLPRTNERLSLIFSEDEGDGVEFYDQNNTETQQQESVNANLQFTILDQVRNRLDFRLDLRSSMRAKASLRYRYELDKALNPTSLLRWNNDVRVEENFSGAKWESQLTYSRQVSDQTALLYYARINEVSSPSYIGSYDLGFRIRKNIGRPWLFAELEPGHSWVKYSKLMLGKVLFFYFFV